MLGAIVGDIVGSVYEWNNIKTKDFPFFRKGCFFTDDSVMTIAVADAIMQDNKKIQDSISVNPDVLVDAMKKWGRLYPDSDYGGRFGAWLFSADREPYNSWGNGSAMRVAPCGFVVSAHIPFDEGMHNVLELAKQSAEVTHNHPEGIMGAQATAAAIYHARHGRIVGDIEARKKNIREDLGKGGFLASGYDLERSLDEIRHHYSFNESCRETVPEAIIAFLESTDFEDAIRNAISLGGDSDTLAAITGSIAEAAYGIPTDIAERALSYLDAPLREVCSRWEKFLRNNQV